MKFPGRLFRNLHLATTPLLGAFVYSGTLREIDAFVLAVQWGAFPLAAGAGLALWLGPRLARRGAGGGAPR
jgi:hypothetical protein